MSSWISAPIAGVEHSLIALCDPLSGSRYLTGVLAGSAVRRSPWRAKGARRWSGAWWRRPVGVGEPDGGQGELVLTEGSVSCCERSLSWTTSTPASSSSSSTRRAARPKWRGPTRTWSGTVRWRKWSGPRSRHQARTTPCIGMPKWCPGTLNPEAEPRRQIPQSVGCQAVSRFSQPRQGPAGRASRRHLPDVGKHAVRLAHA